MLSTNIGKSSANRCRNITARAKRPDDIARRSLNMPTDQLQPNGSVLITGASSGIGLELTKLFAASKHRLILTARNAAALEQLAQECRQSHGIETQIITADLADVAGPQFIFDEIQRRNLAVDILVNNAGFGTHGRFWEIPTQ